LVDWLQTKGIVPPSPAPVEPELLTAFCHWMQAQRGVTETTLKSYRPALRRLLVVLGDQPEHYTVKQLRQFVLERTRNNKTSQVKTTVTVLRMFLRFLMIQGRCAPELLVAIPTIAGWRQAALPNYLGAEAVERVLDTCDCTTTMGARDQAVLLLLARLGLRAGDVAALRLNDIDCEQGLLRVAGHSLASITSTGHSTSTRVDLIKRPLIGGLLTPRSMPHGTTATTGSESRCAACRDL
jgi:site-specific recombinase XerD